MVEDLIYSIADEQDTKEFVLDVLKNQLYSEGVEGYTYSEVTIEIKKRKNQPTNRVTLFDTGDFYKTFNIIATDKAFIIEADDDKNGDNLFDKYDESKVIKFSEDSIKQLKEYFDKKILDKINEELFKIINE